MPRVKAVAVKHCRFFLVVDLAFTLKKENDYTDITCFAVTPHSDLLFIDKHRERMEGPQIGPAIIAMYHKYEVQYAAIESAQAQLLVVQDLRKKGLVIRALKADLDKLSRAIPATQRMEAGQIFLPEGAYWHDDFVAELLAFPRGTHDDQVDTLSYAAVEVQRFGSAAEPDSYAEARQYAETELAAEFFNRAENPLFWVGDDEDA